MSLFDETLTTFGCLGLRMQRLDISRVFETFLALLSENVGFIFPLCFQSIIGEFENRFL
jgi:hypothetical protein